MSLLYSISLISQFQGSLFFPHLSEEWILSENKFQKDVGFLVTSQVYCSF